jgi:hypothetical protein
MAIKEPQVFPPSHRCTRIDGRGYLVFRSVLCMSGRLPCFVQHQIDFGEREAGDLHVEIQIDEGLQLDREYLAIPAGIQGELLSART